MMNWYNRSVLEEMEKVSAPFYNDGKNIAVFQYISPRVKPNLTPREAAIRAVAHEVKDVSNSEAFGFAAEVMAKFVPANAVLIPVPSSSGSTSVNTHLANLIAGLTGSTVVDALTRREPTTPLHVRRKTEGIKGPIDPDSHKMTMHGYDTPSMIGSGQTAYLIDNVITSGSTLEACRKTLNMPELKGLAFAKA